MLYSNKLNNICYSSSDTLNLMIIVLNLLDAPLSCLFIETVFGNHVVRILDWASVMCNYISPSISCQLWNIVLEYPTNACSSIYYICSSIYYICQPVIKFDTLLLTLGPI